MDGKGRMAERQPDVCAVVRGDVKEAEYVPIGSMLSFAIALVAAHATEILTNSPTP